MFRNVKFNASHVKKMQLKITKTSNLDVLQDVQWVACVTNIIKLTL